MHLFPQRVMKHLLMNWFVFFVLFCFFKFTLLSVHRLQTQVVSNEASKQAFSLLTNYSVSLGSLRSQRTTAHQNLKNFQKIIRFFLHPSGVHSFMHLEKQSKISELLWEKGMTVPLLLWKTQLSKTQTSK